MVNRATLDAGQKFILNNPGPYNDPRGTDAWLTDIYVAMKAADPEWVDTLRALSSMTRRAASLANPQ
jgi:hypothetical protein